MLGVAKVTLWRWSRDGLLPPPVRLGPGSIGWRVSTLELWLREREAARR